MTDLLDALAEHKTLGAAPLEELAWLVSRGSLRRLDRGELLSEKGVPVSGLFVILTGHIAIYVDGGGGATRCSSDGVATCGNLQITTSAIISHHRPAGTSSVHRRVSGGWISPAIQLRPAWLAARVSGAGSTTLPASGLHNKKMISLGKLSVRTGARAQQPGRRNREERGAARAPSWTTPRRRRARWAPRTSPMRNSFAIDALARSACLDANVRRASPIQQAEREDAIADWLADHGVDSAIAGPLAGNRRHPRRARNPDRARGQRTAHSTPSSAGPRPAVRFVALRRRFGEAAPPHLRASSSAIKGYTHMDQATVAEAGGPGRRALVIPSPFSKPRRVRNRLKLSVSVEPDLPGCLASPESSTRSGGSSTIRSMPRFKPSGRVEVTANRERQRVVVRVHEQRTRHSQEIRERLFEPFVTTKPVGKGTGLGLDIVRRLVSHNDGEIESNGAPANRVSRLASARPGGAGQGTGVNKPVLLVVDDDPQVLAAVRRTCAGDTGSRIWL